jgi:Aspartyl protease
MVIAYKFLALALFASSLARPAQLQSNSVTAKDTLEPSTVVPLLLEGGRASISVQIDGKGPYRLDIDTGFAGEVLIAKSVADQLALKPIGSQLIGDPSGENGLMASRYKLPVIQVGALTFPDVEAGEDVPMRGPGPRRDGVIGLALFRKYLLTLDYPRQHLSLAVGSLDSAPSSEAIPFRLDHGIPTIKLTLGKRIIEAHVDSGGMGLNIPAGIAKELPLDGPPVPLGRMRTVSNEIEITGAKLAEDAHVAKYTIVKPFIEINPTFPMATFGAIPLSNFRVTFDQASQRIRFQSDAESIELKAPMRRPPASIPQ